jgi:hypothetical protein
MRKAIVATFDGQLKRGGKAAMLVTGAIGARPPAKGQLAF